MGKIAKNQKQKKATKGKISDEVYSCALISASGLMRR
jgi:hypothetical protein